MARLYENRAIANSPTKFEKTFENLFFVYDIDLYNYYKSMLIVITRSFNDRKKIINAIHDLKIECIAMDNAFKKHGIKCQKLIKYYLN